jgi:hypothetical protein
MSLVISNTQYIDGLDLWEASINPLPVLDYENLSYEEKDTGRFYCTNEDAIKEIKACFDKKVIDQKISQPYVLYVEIQKNLPNFELIPHFDNEDILGVIIINLIDSGTSTEFYDVQDVKLKQAPTAISEGIMYLNNWDFKHGYKNSTTNDRYIAICMIKK